MKNSTYLLIFLFIPGCWFVGQATYIHSKAILAQLLLENAWLNIQSGEVKSKPWYWADTWPIARLTVARLNVDLIILAGDSGRTLAFGPGHNFSSVEPGEAGNSLISAHRDTHFSFLQFLKQGDEIVIETALNGRVLFRVIAIQVVHMDEAQFVESPSQAFIHLVTCYPFDAILNGGSLRYMVSAIAISSSFKKT